MFWLKLEKPAVNRLSGGFNGRHRPLCAELLSQTAQRTSLYGPEHRWFVGRPEGFIRPPGESLLAGSDNPGRIFLLSQAGGRFSHRRNNRLTGDWLLERET